ncbi:MAG: hypothetical protein SH857_03570 [Chitinophagales bacterium]|nr:hypothetical protein [Chitinophagales bacterium]
MKVDSIGTKQWDKTILTANNYEQGYAIQTKENWCCAIANYTDAGIGGYKTQCKKGQYDYWIVTFFDSTKYIPQLASSTSTTDVICRGGAEGSATITVWVEFVHFIIYGITAIHLIRHLIL